MRPLYISILLAATAAAQLPIGTTVVACRFRAGPFTTQLLAIDAAGNVQPFGRFAADTLPPLAVEIDAIDRQLLVALDLGGSSLIERLVVNGNTITAQLPVAVLPGPCTQLAANGDSVLATVGGQSGGLYRLQRRGGAPQLLLAQPEASAVLTFGGGGDTVIVAWSGAPAASDPGIGYFDTGSGTFVFGPFPFVGFAPQIITGFIDLPTALSRQLLAFTDGTFALHTASLGNPVPFAVNPQPPAGGAVAFKSWDFAIDGLGLGGQSFPFLYSVGAFSGSLTTIAGPLPGDPVDFAPAVTDRAQLLPFGQACGAPARTISSGASGLPSIGNLQFRIELANATALQPALFVASFDDLLGGALPFTLPGGCRLQVAADAVSFHPTSATGVAVQPLPIPGLPALAGTIVFAQWLQVQAGGFVTSPAAALRIGS
ncbi:MAG TPA: hypothetical protein VK348_07720 [Planctomycetota bacterium]|nr:hypothetical protein [Planctomycetota bacterium]